MQNNETGATNSGNRGTLQPVDSQAPPFYPTFIRTSLRRLSPFLSSSSTSVSTTPRDLLPPLPPPHIPNFPTFVTEGNRSPTSVHRRSQRGRAGVASTSRSAPNPLDVDIVSVGTASTYRTTRYGKFKSIFLIVSHLAILLSTVYYRVYTEDGAIPSMNRVYSDDLHLGRIPAEFVAPPLTAMSLKHCLSGLENVRNFHSAELFLSASSKAPIPDDIFVAIYAEIGPGWTPNEPMALVVKGSDSTRSRQKAVDSSAGRPADPTPFEPRYRKHCNRHLETYSHTD